METKNSFFKPPIISLTKQGEFIKSTYPSFNWSINSKGTLICIGKIKPTPLSTVYTIKITYKVDKKPIIEVIAPKLDGQGKKIPHTYTNGSLCLYRPKYNEWSKYDFIADKIIPWTSLWLFYYETWKITGQWLGGGEHPTCNTSNKNISLKRLK